MQIADPTTGAITEESLRTYNEYMERLEDVSEVKIHSFHNKMAYLGEALRRRHDFFHENGCRLSDHGFGLFSCPWVETRQTQEFFTSFVENFARLRNGEIIDDIESLRLRICVLSNVACLNYEKGWTMQLHLGAMRNNNTQFYQQLGPDAGFDSMIDGNIAESLSRFFDMLNFNETLPKTIVYNLNPAWNDMLVTLLGNFQDGKTPGKMQFGSGWWFLDQKKGMEDQLNALSNHGLLSQFVGMLTDSRSFLSYTRHEYFRRILCNLLGEDMRTGLLPNDFEMIGKLVQDICYYNAKNYFGFA
jgi:glucuronate isomerase